MTVEQYYARAILNRDPKLTNAQVRLAVLDKTDKMLADTQIDKARRLTERTMGITKNRSVAILMSEGWTAYEAKEIMDGLHTSIDSPWILDCRKKRVDEIIYAETHGSSRKAFLDAVVRWYELDKSRSPFEFLRREYRPPRKLGAGQYDAALKRRQQARTATASIYKRKYPEVDKRKSHHKKGLY